ncbi:MAG: hypothetical protein Q4A70_00625 [Candidatus Saccharibacteria bacterium]|nr:hypothetical protein [Candidatus Saccharibacteria bacterium]
MTEFGEGGGGFRNNTNGPIEGLEMGHPRRTAEMAAAAAERQQRRNEIKAERTEKIEKIKSIGRKVLAVVIAAGGITLLALTGEKEKGMGIPLSQTEWEDTMKKETAGYGASIQYEEDGSSIAFVDSHNGVQTYYYFEDSNNDSYVEQGHASNATGGADGSFGDGATIKDAVYRLNTQMDKNN